MAIEPDLHHQRLPVGRATPVGWVVVIVVAALALSVALPVLVFAQPLTTPAAEGETLALVGGEVEVHGEWDVVISQTSLSSPTLAADGVEVQFSSGIWLGSTDALAERVQDWLVDADQRSTIADAPEFAEDEELRSVRFIDAGDDGGIYVVHQELWVVTMQVTGNPSAIEARQDDLDAMLHSVWVEPFTAVDIPVDGALS